MNGKSKLQWIILGCALIGLIDSIYLAWIKFSNTEALCLPGIGNCEVVNTSRYSQVFGIPVAIFGAAVYLVILLVVVFEERMNFLSEFGRLTLFGISLFGVLYSAYLTYVEFGILKAVCPFCLLSAIVMVIIFFSAVVRMAASPAS